MSNTEGTRYNSLLDWSTWLIVLFCVLIILWPLLIERDSEMIIALSLIAVVFFGFLVAMFKGTYYRINGNNLVIYQFFKPTEFPIDKIESVMPCRSMLSAPATSVVNRLAIKFSDRKVLKSSMPMYISPERQKEFIAQLLTVNPSIKTAPSVNN